MSNVFPMAIVAPNRLAGSVEGASKSPMQLGSFGDYYSGEFEKKTGEAAFLIGEIEPEIDQGSHGSFEKDLAVEVGQDIEQREAFPKFNDLLETDNLRNLNEVSVEFGPKLEKAASLTFSNITEMISKESFDVIPTLQAVAPVEMRSENTRQIVGDVKPGGPILQGLEKSAAFAAFSANIQASATAARQVVLTDESRKVSPEKLISASVAKSEGVAPAVRLPERPLKHIEQLRGTLEKSSQNVDPQPAKLSDTSIRVVDRDRNVSRVIVKAHVQLGAADGASSRSAEGLLPAKSKSGFKASEAVLNTTKPQADPQIPVQSGATTKAEVRVSNVIGNLNVSPAPQPTNPARIPITPEAPVPAQRFTKDVREDSVSQTTIAPPEKAIPATLLFTEGKTTTIDHAIEGFEQHDQQLIGRRTEITPQTSATHELKHHTNLQIASSVGHQIAVEVSKLQGGTTEIALNPEELGRVSLSMKAVEGSVTLVISAERPETQDLMRRHIETLAQEFRALGYNDVNLSFQGHGQGEQDDSDKGRSQAVLDPDDVEASEIGKPRLEVNGLDLRL